MVRRFAWIGCFLALACVWVGCSEAPPAPVDDTAVPDVPVPVDTTLDEDTGSPSDTSEPVDTAQSVDSVTPPDTVEPPEDVQPAEDVTPDTGELAPCDPPLELGPFNPIVPTYGFLQLEASGGTGNYRFVLGDAPSGSQINLYTGSYISGPVGGVIDRVQLTDTGCVGNAELDVQVVQNPTVIPGEVSIPPGACVKFQVLGGSGNYTFELVTGVPLGTIDNDGLYSVEGQVEGTDVVRVRDTKTDQTQDAFVYVSPLNTFETQAQKVVIPLGSTFKPPVVGGSGYMVPSVEGDSVTNEDGVLKAVATGKSTVTFNDEYVICMGANDAAWSTSVEVEVATSIELPETLHNSVGTSRVIPSGDLDGDGIPEGVVGIERLPYSGFRSGAVVVYKGTETGLEPTPIWVAGPQSRLSYFGRQALIRDFDGDGHPDLLAAGREESGDGTRRGAVYLYKGIEDGVFTDEPSQIWRGTEWYEYMGAAITVCDFNGDGLEDLAVGAERAEDESVSPVKGDQGAVFIYWGTDDGFSEEIGQHLFGKVLSDGGDWVSASKLYFGNTMASGDFDGDGVCDLVAGANTYQGSSGYILLFKGVLGEGVTELPVAAWAGNLPEKANTRLGWGLEMHDINQDGKSDIVTSQYERDIEGANEAGALRIFLGKEISEDPVFTFESPDTADWTVTGKNGGDRLGFSLMVGDADGDGIADIVASARDDEETSYPSNTGVVAIYRGQLDDLPEQTPMRRIPGKVSGDYFGYSAGLIGDLDGDGFSELLVHASGAEEDGPDLGRMYMVWGSKGPDIPLGATWAYHDAGEDLGTDWTALDYDDSAWLTGAAELGYGESDEATVLDKEIGAKSVYFRKKITLNGPIGHYIFRYRVDDGLGIYVNGELVHTYNLSEGEDALDFGTSAASQKDNAWAVFKSGPDDLSPFVEGENVIAVIVKQANKAGGDLSFNLELQTFQAADPNIGMMAPLTLPHKASNDQNGYSVAIVKDVTGDGHRDLLVGAPGAAPGDYRLEAGQVLLFEGNAKGGFFETPKQTFFGFRQTGNGIEVGRAVSTAGDFDGDGKHDFVILARESNQPKSYDKKLYNAPGACKSSKSSVGAAYVFLGGKNIKDEPAFIYFGPQGNKDPAEVAGGFDFDGDNYDDIAMGSRSFVGLNGEGAAGGVVFVRGQSDDPDKTTIICEPDLAFFGDSKDDQMGRSIVALGKIDDDDCDEVAVSADLDDVDGKSNQGALRVIFGYGPNCASPYPRVLTLAPGAANSRSGYDLSAGDVDGDGIPDLIVGAPEWRQGSFRLGAAFVIRGSYLKTLEGDLTITGDLPQKPTIHPYAPTPEEVLMVKGSVETTSGQSQAWFGAAVTYVPEVGPGLAGGFAVSAPRGDLTGTSLAGDVRVYRYTNEGTLELMTMIGGETARVESKFGEALSAGTVGGQVMLSIGAFYGTPDGSITSIDNGSVYNVVLKD